MSSILARRMAPQSNQNPQLVNLMWRYSWIPIFSVLFVVCGKEMRSIQAQRDHNQLIIRTYNRYKVQFPYSYAQKWRKFVRKEIREPYWWRPWRGKSMIQGQFFDPFLTEEEIEISKKGVRANDRFV